MNENEEYDFGFRNADFAFRVLERPPFCDDVLPTNEKGNSIKTKSEIRNPKSEIRNHLLLMT